MEHAPTNGWPVAASDARSRSRGAGRRGPRRRNGCRTSPEVAASTSPSTRGATRAAWADRGSSAVRLRLGPFQSTKSRTSSFAYSSTATRRDLRSRRGRAATAGRRPGKLAIRKKTEPSSVRTRARLQEALERWRSSRGCARSPGHTSASSTAACPQSVEEGRSSLGQGVDAGPSLGRARMILSSTSVRSIDPGHPRPCQRRSRTSRSANRNDRKLPMWTWL